MQIYLRFLDGITIIEDNETEICKIDFILDMIKKITDASRDQIKISCDCEGICRFSPYKERRDARSRHPFKDGDMFNVVITPLFNIRYADIEKDVVKYYLKNGSNISDDQYHDKLIWMNNLSYESEGCPVYLYEWTKWNAEEKRYMTFFRNTTISELQDLHDSYEVSPIAKERLVYLIQNHERDVYRS